MDDDWGYPYDSGDRHMLLSCFMHETYGIPVQCSLYFRYLCHEISSGDRCIGCEWRLWLGGLERRKSDGFYQMQAQATKSSLEVSTHTKKSLCHFVDERRRHCREQGPGSLTPVTTLQRTCTATTLPKKSVARSHHPKLWWVCLKIWNLQPMSGHAWENAPDIS